MSEHDHSYQGVEYRDMGELDLTWAKSAEDLAGIRSIHDVGIVLIPEQLMAALRGVTMHDVGAVVAVPEGADVSLFNGQTKLTGEALAAAKPGSILIANGQTFITTMVKEVAYGEIRIKGQLFAPRGSEAALAPKLRQLSGQVIYHHEGARFVMGSLRMSAAFLQELSAPTAFLVMGRLEIEDDVPAEQLRSKVPEIALMGEISVPRHLQALVEAITVERYGKISVR